ncbi:uncharacterized protein LOC124494140 isoform X1 [Dermatophagoides farinae]|uniref:uncharacterized protein LOC124494140 isoform X1 n=2 Tax=Dermatophagoides farinae TaxID=6954 RepID=UPI003F63C12C
MSSLTDSPRLIKTSNGGLIVGHNTNNNNNNTVSSGSFAHQTILTTTSAKSTTSSSLLATALLPASSTSTISSTSLSSTSSSSGKKSRKNDSSNSSVVNNNNNNNNNPNTITENNHNANHFLPIAPQTFFQHPSQPGLTLASVHQQIQPGSVAVFTSPTMAMATIAGTAGPQATVHQQQGTSPGQTLQHPHQSLVVNGAMTQQFSTGTFQTANGQIIQAAPGMQMIGGLPTQVQVIGANGQPAYFPQFYTAGQMQPTMLLNNLSMAIPAQNPSQGLAIQLPTTPTNAGTTMITTTGQMTHQTANQPTPVKGHSNQTTIMKGVTISPQQNTLSTQANKTNASTNATKTQQQHHHQQQVIQPTAAFQQNTTNPTFVIGLAAPHNSTATQNGQTTTILQPTSTPPSSVTNARKTTSSGRSNNKGTSLIQKIQPTSPLLTQAQFKTNTSFGTTSNTTSPAPGQTIMVHGQSIQTGPNGSIQLAPNQPTIISPLTSFQTLQPSITWTTSPQLNQTPTQLVAPNGQILIRTQGPNDSPHMLIQTSNNQFQAVPMQMTPTNGDQQQNHQQNAGPMQVTPTGQPTMMATSSINPTMPISIQTNPGVATMSTAMVNSQQQLANSLPNTTMLTMVSSSGTSTLTTATTLAQSRQRPLRPAASIASSIPLTTTTVQTTNNAIQNSTAKSKSSANNIPKLAPKGSTSASLSSSSTSSLSSSPSIVSNFPKAQPSSLATINGNNSTAKVPLPVVLPKTSAENITNGAITMNCKIQKSMITCAQSVNNSTSIMNNNNTSVSSSTSTQSFVPPQNNNLVSGMTATGTNTSFNGKLNRNKPQTEKKDAASGTENNNKSSTLVSSSTSTINLNLKSQMKPNSLNSMRNNSLTNTKNKIPIVLSSGPLLTNNTNQLGKIPNHQTVNGTQTPPTSSANKTLTMMNGGGGGLTNGVLAKSNTTNTIPSTTNTGSQVVNNKTKQNDPNNQVLTHVIDGYVIQESANPFPINGFLTSSEFDPQKSNGVVVVEKMELDPDNKDLISAKLKENGLIPPNSQPGNQPQSDHSKINDPNSQILDDLCVSCKKNKRLLQAKKKKWKRFCQTCIDRFLNKKKNFKEQQQYLQQPPNFIGNSSAMKTSTSSIQTHQTTTTAAIVTAAVVGSTKMNSTLATNSNSTLLPTTPIVNGLGGVGGKHSSVIGVSTPPGAVTSNISIDIGQNMAKRPLNQQSAAAATINIDQQQANKRLRLSSPTNVIGNSTQTTGDVAVSNGNNVNTTNGKTLDSLATTSSTTTTTLTTASTNDDKMWLPANGTKEPGKWTVQEVYEFMSHCDGCSDLADGFKSQEIDGQALMLIKEDHIIDILNTKLGPALKICRKIKELKEHFNY